MFYIQKTSGVFVIYEIGFMMLFYNEEKCI